MYSRHELTAPARTVGGALLGCAATVVLATALLLPATAAAQTHRRHHAERAASSTSHPERPRMKGIWEPVNYDQDLTLRSVYFATPDIGWASGDGGTIVHTVDGGAHWTAQLGGDPQNDAYPVTDLQFVDQRHGFAVQKMQVGDARLLRTVDGIHWRASGTVAEDRDDYRFVTPTVGFLSHQHEILRTRDAGRSWQRVMTCATRLVVSGLARNVTCRIRRLTFVTPLVGYGVGPGDVDGIFIEKTTDGGATWTIRRVLPDESARQSHLTFTDAAHGFLCTFGGHFFATSDGGATWDGVAGSDCTRTPLLFADPRTGWMIDEGRWIYSTDGGANWNARPLQLPASTWGFSFPRRDRGYVVGEHGMVYRYRIVPAQYAAAGAIDAPVVGAFDSDLEDQAQQLVSDATALAGDTASGGGRTASGAGVATAQGEASTPAGAHKGRLALEKLRGVLDALGATMPDFLGRYRNLNLVYEGARTADGMQAFLQTVRTQFAAFRAATDRNGAADALAQLVTAARSLEQETSVAFFQRALPDDAGAMSGDVGTAGTAANGDVAGTGGAAAATGSIADSAAAAVRDSAANAVKDAAKKQVGRLLRLPFGHRP